MTFKREHAIQNALARLASDHAVRILYACESGSRAWGFASRDSDYDVRFLYARKVEDYLTLKPHRDVIEHMQDDLDLAGWDIFKACKLLAKSNPPLLEWLGSPIVYLEGGGFAEGLRTQAQKWFSCRACCEHYLSMTRSNFSDHVDGREKVVRKKYLYVLRPLACVRWLLVHGAFPPTPFIDVLDGIQLPPEVRADVGRLLADKRANREMGIAGRIPSIGSFLQAELDGLPEKVAGIPGRRFRLEGLNELISSTLLGRSSGGTR